jgi:hypothetical protein
MPRPTDAEVITAEARRPAEHPDALDYILRGRSAYNHWPIRDNYAQPVRLFEQALALNPRSVEAQTWMASVLATRALRRDRCYADAFRAIMLAFVIATLLVPLLRNVAAATPSAGSSH